MMHYPQIPALDHLAMQAATDRQHHLTKPTGSMGDLEKISIKLAGIQGNPLPLIQQKAVVVMAADHGITQEGVSAYPAEVTPQMVMNFLNGGAAINVLARQASARVVIVDIGVNYDFQDAPGLIHRKVARGTANFLRGPAMTLAQAEEAIQTGIDIASEQAVLGLDLIATGDMGIGNTSAASAITAAFTGLPVSQVTGRGTGIDDAGLIRKIEVIEKALAFNHPDPAQPMDVLCKVGGLEIAGLAGVIIGSAARRIPIVVDGFISGSAALIAAELVPEVQPYLIASHQSVEIGHRAIWNHLGLKPILNLGMRLGEGTGSALAFHIIEAAANILREMATFSEAHVSES
jgi:nicotinate-nucleotide--dimethylbenzimidazole phosphoribosyltransferase